MTTYVIDILVAFFIVGYVSWVFWDKQRKRRRWIDVARAQALMPAVFLILLSLALPLPMGVLLLSWPLIAIGGGIAFHWTIEERRRQLSERARLQLASLAAESMPALVRANETDVKNKVRKDDLRDALSVRLPLVIAGMAGALGSWWFASGAALIAGLGYLRGRDSRSVLGRNAERPSLSLREMDSESEERWREP